MEKYIETIEEIEEIEKVVIQDTKLKRCCTLSLEILKTVIIYFKNIKTNINGKKEKEKE